MHVLIFTSVIFLFPVSALGQAPDYYWREYTGNIPDGAIVGGKNRNGESIYIGQAYLRNNGLIVVEITPGIKEVYVPWYGVTKIDTYVKILCGHQDNFYWERTNASNLHLFLIDKCAVIGGHHDGQGIIHIGRTSYNGETKIGKIDSWQPENANYYLNDKGKVQRFTSYQILLYRKPLFDVRMEN